MHSSNSSVHYSALSELPLGIHLLNLFHGQGGRLVFTIEHDGLVSDVLDYVVLNGLQPADCTIVQVCIICMSVCVCVCMCWLSTVLL